MKNLDSIIKFLSNLGLSFEQSKVYLALLDTPEQTILTLSRATKISRTNVYRIIDDLRTLGLIEEIRRDSKKYINPVGPHKLELIVKEQESKVDFLKKILPELSSLIATSESLSQPGTRVQLYKGPEGIKQMVWNTLKANKECIGYTFRTLKEIVGEKFEKEWRDEFIFRKLKMRDLVSDSYLASTVSNTSINGEVQNFKTRYLPQSVLDINHQMDIYNDVVAFYTWYDQEVFGIEIYNRKIADFQRQMFELAWEKGAEVE